MRQLLRFCLDPRVLVAFSALAVAIWLVAPSLLLAALPALIALACPVSMAVMAWTMRPAGGTRADTGQRNADALRAELVRLDVRRAELDAELVAKYGSTRRTTSDHQPGVPEVATR